MKGEGNQLDFGARIYDPRIARWLSVDPLQKKYPSETPYLSNGGNPIFFKDSDGRDRIVTITIHNQDGTTLQVQKTYTSSQDFNYYADATLNSGYDYYKRDVIINIEINLPATGVSWQEAMKTPDNVISTETHDGGWYDISALGYLMGRFSKLLPADGDESGNVKSGRWRLYGNGTDMDWQSGLPTGDGSTESINLGGLIDLLGMAKAAESPINIADYIKDPDGKIVFEVFKKQAEAMERIKKSAEFSASTSESSTTSDANTNNPVKQNEGGRKRYSGYKKGTILYIGEPTGNVRVDSDSTGTCCQDDKKATDTIPSAKNKN